ncbi:iron-siderophore ABC transporter substrate-binding protein [Rhodococcus jostii]|uniref:Iron complex transport system substrate-binding protein n=1 Tax=Rhodococcus jostii TaxID=132919 RepID=A0A1H4Z0I5_RHOJO|nr:iron-siderophore ABC transporter substrate-binding protein [Rhodococcus jostii]SED23653.1 iron complex transport system substrate-binding protein [Rhodococcus jostii]
MIRVGAVGIAAVAAFALVLSGCSSTQDTASSTITTVVPPAATGDFVAPRTVPEGMGSGKPDGEFPRTVAHFQGETTLDAEPEKVVVISTGQADALLSLGVVPAGSTRGDGAELIPPYLLAAYPQYRSGLDSVVDAGGRFTPNYEAIANLAPDLILMNTAGKDADTLYAQLSAIAPTVATQGTGVYWKQDFLLAADALGRTEQAQSLLDTFHADAAAVGTSLGAAPTVSFTRQNGNRLRIFGVPSFTGSIAEDAGLARPASQQFGETSRDISEEELTVADAEWIFYGVQGGDASTLTKAPLWPELQAVRAGRAIPVDDDVFYLNTGPTAARQVLTVLGETVQQK